MPPGLADGFESIEGGRSPRFSTSDIRARVQIPDVSIAPTRLDDVASEAGIDISLDEALTVDAEAADGYVIFPQAHVSGATLFHRAMPDGLEDYLSFEKAPAKSAISYALVLRHGIAGLRLVASTLEMLDAAGTPRLRVAPPYLIGADGARTDATLAVKGCRVDTSPAAPWGRRVIAPGSTHCTIQVSWPGASVKYPAVLDPRWTTTGSMATARQDHTAILLPTTGKVLVAGGRTSGASTTGLTTAELFDKATGTWASTGAMTGGRWSHSATLLNTSSNSTTSGKVLVAGGINGTASLTTAQLYSPSAGTWIAAANLNAARHVHTATSLPNGSVLVAGGMTGTTPLQTAAVYNPASGTGAWTATTGPIPPPSLRFHSATLIVTSNQQLNGKVLLAGGNNGTTSIASVFLFDTVQSAFSTLASMPSAREGHTAVVLPNGKILLTGGKNGSMTLATAVVFDPSSGPGSWSSAGTMTSPRWGHTAVVLPSGFAAAGQVLVAGGSNGSSTQSSAELFSGTSTWTATSSMPAPVQQHTATILAGTILIAGGVNGSAAVPAARLYDGSFALSCTSGSQCATGFCANGVCCDTACNGGCGACNLTGQVGTCRAIATGTACPNDGNACTTDLCNGSSLSCQHATGNAGATCRAAAGDCDISEVCSGTSSSCPGDAKKASGVACPDDGNACTRDQCDGTNAACQHPAGNAGSVCRAAGGDCDIAETCSGTSATCPSNAKQANGAACPDDGNACTRDQCDGTNVACQHPAGNAGSVCRAAGGDCDIAETCSGTSATCPTNAKKANGAACPDDGNACTRDQCDGTNVVCQHPVGNAGAICRVAFGSCDVPETCTGTSTACPTDGMLANGATCSDGNACTQGDVCQEGDCMSGNAVECADDSVLGFETLSAWSASASTLEQSFDHTQGRYSLAVSNSTATAITSRSVATLPSVGPAFLLDIRVPGEQPDPASYGSVQLFVTLPSQGVTNAALGQVNLFDLPVGSFKTIQFAIPADLATKLRTAYTDLTFKIALNVTPGAGTYFFDNLRSDFDRSLLTPTLSCVAQNGSTYTAFFGYTNASSGSIAIPIGSDNGFLGSTFQRGQPTQFLTGPQVEAFSVVFDGNPITWRLGSKNVDASSASPPCSTVTCQ